ncbi:MAG: hypothetical protein HYY06_31685 [Deltaproteobacteria bacterium]|nr:hypothetical protein [Deltaproteobacteria bacterium]
MARWLILSLLLLAAAVDCGGTNGGGGGDGDSDSDVDADGDSDQGECVDLDGDGAGRGDGCRADDCDDTDPGTTDECGTQCDSSPLRKGCPCTEGQVVSCYMGPEGTAQGNCSAGLKSCEGGVLGECEGQSLPEAAEICDGKDNDCNGETDEGVLSACGDCNSECEHACVGVDCDAGFDMEDARSVEENADGSLTLSGATTVQNYVIWVANSQEGTVSKVDTRTRLEEGRYATGPGGGQGWGLNPSRTTVNPRGDVVVANRDHGSATYIRASDCEDENGNGVIDTSGGGDDVLAWGEDECAVWNVDGIPAARGSAFEERAELDAGIREYVWVCSYPFTPGTCYEIDPVEGEKTGREVGNVGGYGAAMAPDGILWVVGLGGCPTSVDTTTLERTDWTCPAGEGAYGIAVDSEGRVWIGSTVARLDPFTETWESPPANVTGGGITVDAEGNAWVGEWGSAWKVDGETMEATQIPNAGGHGWAVDYDGFIWSIDMGQNEAHVVDPDTFEVEDVTPPFNYPYTYSDMTGFGLQNTITPEGVVTQVFEGCPADQETHWADLGWLADVPAGTQIAFRVQTASTLEELGGEGFIDVATDPPDESPVSVGDALDAAGVPHGRFLLLETRLRSVDRMNRPTFYSEYVDHSCSNIFE